MVIPYEMPCRYCGYKDDLESFSLTDESGKLKPME